MKSLKGRFITTTILMAIISTALVIFITLLLLFVFSIHEPDGFKRILMGIKSAMEGSQNGMDSLLAYGTTWAFLAVFAVIITCVGLSAKLSREILVPLRELQNSAEKITIGDLNFDVLSCEDKELNDLCNAFEEIRKKLKANREQELKNIDERNMLMANLSHDLRTPITTIKGYLEGIKDGVANSPEKMDKYLDTIYNKTIILQKLVDNMTEYSELELGKMQYAFEFLDITDFIKSWTESYRQELSESGFVLVDNITEEKLTVVADKSKLKRVFDNLISNAVKYNKENGTITLSLEKQQNGAIICISDTGNGIREVDIGRVFDGFYRGDAARSNIKGNGLGLGISKQIVESHHGKIWIKSEEKVGTSVYIYLPLRII